jgi:transcription-repair coupling factor (superfamily II helicase)
LSFPLPRSPLPEIGERLQYPIFAGSADALLIAQAASEASTARARMLAVFTANAGDAQRLLQEIPWFAANLRVRLLPDWETLPYDSFSPHHDLVSERLATLYAVTARRVRRAAGTRRHRRLPPRTASLSGRLHLLPQAGREARRRAVPRPDDAGRLRACHAGRGTGRVLDPWWLVDLFPMGSPLPYRLDLFDNEIESIKTFDVDNQRTLYPVPEVRLLPAREFPLDETGTHAFPPALSGDFRRRPRSLGDLQGRLEWHCGGRHRVLATAFLRGNGHPFRLPAAPHRALPAQHVPAAIRDFWHEAQSRYSMLSGDRSRPLLPPADLFLAEEPFFVAAKAYARIDLKAGHEGPARGLPALAIDRRADNPLGRLQAFLAAFPGRVLLLAETAGRRETLSGLFSAYGLKPQASAGFSDFLATDSRLSLAVGPLHDGFQLAQLAIVTEAELYADSPSRRARHVAQRKASVDNWLRDLTELKVGSPVVHEQHGIGRYQGLVHLDLGEGEMEFLELHYAEDARLYVPVSQLHVIARYSGSDPDTAPLHALGSPQWEKAKRRAALQARDTAAELLALYALRAARQGHACEFTTHDYDAFADGFGFEETPDQATAIAAVIEDMQSGRPMDRLVCGDVGFGKTEVALRAAFCAVAGGRQVAVLCPTTLLCEQHFQTFSDRFADWPVRIAELSRFKTSKEAAQALQELADGRLDIVIGTHRLLQKDVRFSRLGLVIIDEEHRFGVRQKEALKALRAEVDVLTLTATPIPRTLAMSLEGLRDFSVIATAPQKRLAIKTFVSRFSDGVIREALLREFKRGGQVYFLHNEVDTIENMRDKLGKLLPEARIVVGHGQMKERELERVMRDFTQQRVNLLLCTTIIETGIDNPHANTIIINRAEKFGLAQLHQLRGRVGRSHHQAYAYLLTHDEAALNKQARQRLEAIQMMDELGAGFYLAMHDLEIRGAGEVLGANQSGEMQEVGFNLFTEMLKRAVAALKLGKEPDLMQALTIATEIKLHTPALLPDDYAPDVHERLTLYKRLADCEAADDSAICRKNWSIASERCRRRLVRCSTATGCACSASRSGSASSTPTPSRSSCSSKPNRRSTRCASSI